MMKKILFYTDTVQLGGAENQSLLLAQNLDKSKFEVSLLCGGSKALDPWCKKFEAIGVKVIRVKSDNKHSFKHYLKLREVLKKDNFDILHAHVWNPASCRYAYLAAGRSKTPLIITEHDPFKLNSLKDLYKKWSLKKVQKIITVSEHNKRMLAELYPKMKNKIEVVHNGVDSTWWQSQLMGFRTEDRKKIKKEIFHANEDSLIVTSIAELHKRKGIDILLKAIKEIVTDHQNIKFVFIGDGPDKKTFIELAEQLKLERHVVFLGKKNNIAPLLSSSDIFVLPSRREAFGLVNLEAMLCKLPVIASRVGGIPEIVEDGKTGLVIAPESPQALKNAINKLIKDPEKRHRFAEAGYQRAVEKFSAKQMAKGYEDIYSSI